MLSKEEILKKLQEDEFITLEEKAFYRKIEELRELGYDVRSTKGNRTKYFLDTIFMKKQKKCRNCFM